MDPRVLFSVIIFAGFGMFFNVVVTNPAAVPKDISSDIAELFQDCKISNSVTFTECLRRVKKQTHLHDIDSICLERCMAECAKERRGDCAESCKYCTQRTARYINRVINITETVDEGENKNNSVSNKSVIVNVTNHIHIHNHYNTSSTPTATSPAPTATSPNKINVNQQYCPCYFVTWFPCYCRPQYPIYQYPYQWPSFPCGEFGQIGLVPRPSIQDGYTFILRPNIPISTTKPTIPMKPTISTEPTIPIEPTEPTIPTGLTEPTGPTEPTISTESIIRTTKSHLETRKARLQSLWRRH